MPALSDLPPPDAAPDQPAQPAPPASPDPAAASASPGPGLPIPFSAIAAGTLPGLQIPPISKGDGVPDAMQDYVVRNLHNLMQAGIDYHDLPNHVTVLFNPDKVDVPTIEKAYKDGTLDKVVPTAKAFTEFVKKQTGTGQGALASPDAAPGGAAAPTAGPQAAPAPLAAAPGPKPSIPAGVAKARLANVVPPGPGIKPNPIPNRLAKRAL